MINCKKYYFNESSYILLKVNLSEISFEKIKEEDFLMTETVGKIRNHILYVCELLTVINLILSIGIAGKEGTTNLSAELLL